MGLFTVQGGSKERHFVGAPLPASPELAGVKSACYDAETGVYSFVIDVPTTTAAFALAGRIFRPAFGNEWWAEIAALPHFN